MEYQSYVYVYKNLQGEFKSGTIQAKNMGEAKAKFKKLILPKGFKKFSISKSVG